MLPSVTSSRHITYGPIVTGRRPDHVEGGIRVIRQNDFTDTGLKVDDLLRVESGCVYDPPRSRVRKGDLLLPRSGAGFAGAQSSRGLSGFPRRRMWPAL